MSASSGPSGISDSERVLAVIALESGTVDLVDVVLTIRDARRSGLDALEVAVGRGIVSEAALLAAIGSEIGYQAGDLFDPNLELNSDETLLARCDVNWLEKLVALPMIDGSGQIVVAAQDPTDPRLGDYLGPLFPEGFTILLAQGSQIRQVLLTEASRSVAAGIEADISPVFVDSDDPLTTRGPVLDWIDTALLAAAAQRCSDLHFEIEADGRMLYRLRIDGVLVPQPMPLAGREMEVIAAIMSKTTSMDSSNMLEPQDSSFHFTASGRRIDVRVSMMPLINGPKLVLRLLDPANLMSLEDLGYDGKASALLRRAGDMPQGLIIIAGPTGSGKTTTLYALIQGVASPEKNVMTIEDPVEFRLPLVSQIPIRTNRGDRSVTGARILRGILRLDPDVILVGEVRDGETAKTALEAALTGHLVLTTIHANSAVGVFTRLVELGAPPYLVAEAITLSASQRLVRRLHSCRRVEEMSDEAAAALVHLGLTPPASMGVATGCSACGHRGFRGRIAVASLSAPDDEIRKMIARGASLPEIEEASVNNPGYVDMRGDVQKLLDSQTIPPSEAVRALALGEM